MKLTQSQRDAIEHGGTNLQLIACAGSGKTEVVARRVVHLLDPKKADFLQPANILAFTFTDKAAAELKERIVTRTKESLGDIHGLAEMFVGTIHAFALDLIKSEVPKYLKFEVLNEVQQGLFVDRHSKQSGLTASTDLKGKPLRRYVDTRNFTTALSILREAELDDTRLTGCSVLDELDTYRNLLDNRSYLDYSSILEALVDVLTNDGALRERLAARVKYVIVDEYQDVNPVQEAIVWSLHDLGARVCVVGDDDTRRKRLTLTPRGSIANVVFSFSDLKYFFECPYQFKLRVFYGFNVPIHEALGYGKSLHDALAEVHARAIQGDIADDAEVPRLVDTHLHVPYAYASLREQLEAAATRVLRDYMNDNAELFDKIEFSEKSIELNLGDGVSVVGRIDLVRRIDTDEVSIVDLKSSDRAQAEDVTETQLHVYALGYQELTGRAADYVEIYELG